MTISFPRRRILSSLRQRPHPHNPRHKPSLWAIECGYATVVGDSLHITASGIAAIEYEELPVEAKAAQKLLPRLKNKALVRSASSTEEARQEGGGYLYFTEPDHRPFPTISARVLIERGWLEPAEDGLFAGMSQTFRVPRHA